MSFYISFYQNKTKNPDGLFLNDILNYTDKQLEDKHNFIQYLFPLESKSKYNPKAPIIDQKFILEAQHNPEIKKNIVRSFGRMMDFYGFHTKTKPLHLEDREEKKQWLTKGNHNFLRLTRIIDFLFLVKMDLLAYILFEQLCKLKKKSDVIDSKTFGIWQSYFK